MRYADITVVPRTYLHRGFQPATLFAALDGGRHAGEDETGIQLRRLAGVPDAPAGEPRVAAERTMELALTLGYETVIEIGIGIGIGAGRTCPPAGARPDRAHLVAPIRSAVDTSFPPKPGRTILRAELALAWNAARRNEARRHAPDGTIGALVRPVPLSPRLP